MRIHEESYGKGARRTETFVGDDWVIVVLDDIELLPNENFLVERGEHELVTRVRTQYQVAVRANFSAAVERATGRTVIGFASTTTLADPPFSVEIFRLG